MNLLHFFSNYQESKSSVQLLDGQLTVFQRAGSKYWQCRFKLKDGQWYQASTNFEFIGEAKIQAVAIYEAITARSNLDLSIRKKKFSEVAREECENLSSALVNGSGKTTYRDYIFALNKYLIPFFGNYPVDEISLKVIEKFECWRVSEMGKVPMASTMRNHASAYNRVISLAYDQNVLSRAMPVPLLNARGKKGAPRPAFTKEEIDELVSYMEKWEGGGRLRVEKQLRPLCRCYVEFLIYTGARHATEVVPIKWKNIQWHWIGEKKYLRVWVSGKTGPRYLIAKNQALAVLDRLRIWQNLEFQSLEDLIEAKLDRRVFCYPDGDVPHRFEGVFRKLMRDSGLSKDDAGRTRTLYSLRHSYATFALAEGISIHTLAKQMGTSVSMIERHYSKMTPMMSAESLA